jgi:hypothetical protein
VDLSSIKGQGRFLFIDGFSGLFSGEKQEKQERLDMITVDPKEPIILILTQHILKALETQKGRPTMFIEGLDFLLAATNISPNDLLGLLSNISSVTPLPPFQRDTNSSLPPASLSPYSRTTVSSPPRLRWPRTTKSY